MCTLSEPRAILAGSVVRLELSEVPVKAAGFMLHDVVSVKHVDDELIHQREDAFRSYQALPPPRVLTSDGKVVPERTDAIRSAQTR